MNPLQNQVGGDHYAKLKIQPVEYIHANGLGFIEGSVIKYVTRHKSKGGRQDIEKAIHFLELLIEIEYGDGAKKEAVKTYDACKAQFIGPRINWSKLADFSMHDGSVVKAEITWLRLLLDTTKCPSCQLAASDAISAHSKA